MRRRLILVVVALTLLLGGLGWRLLFPPMPALAQRHGGDEQFGITITQFEWATERVAWVDPPRAFERWVAQRSALLGRLMERYRTGYEPVPEGTILLFVEADLVARGAAPLTSRELMKVEYRIDYGSYTIGANRGGWSDAGPTKQIETQFELTRGERPVALEIKVGEIWYRFPVR